MSEKMLHGYADFSTWGWKTYDGSSSIDIVKFVNDHRDNHFFIGTDSQNYAKKKQVCVFTSVLIAYKMGKGGIIITHIDKVSRIESLRQRLLMEAMRSLEVGWFLNQHVPSKSIIGIHLDVNASLRFKSGQYKDELVGLIMAQGFNALVKPNSWAASTVADSKT
ncbi:MAG: ribonuclease H-like YkuK family protein [Methanomassiliicoccales archaeon]|jgi:hypothetical protein